MGGWGQRPHGHIAPRNRPTDVLRAPLARRSDYSLGLPLTLPFQGLKTPLKPIRGVQRKRPLCRTSAP